MECAEQFNQECEDIESFFYGSALVFFVTVQVVGLIVLLAQVPSEFEFYFVDIIVLFFYTLGPVVTYVYPLARCHFWNRSAVTEFALLGLTYSIAAIVSFLPLCECCCREKTRHARTPRRFDNHQVVDDNGAVDKGLLAHACVPVPALFLTSVLLLTVSTLSKDLGLLFQNYSLCAEDGQTCSFPGKTYDVRFVETNSTTCEYIQVSYTDGFSCVSPNPGLISTVSCIVNYRSNPFENPVFIAVILLLAVLPLLGVCNIWCKLSALHDHQLDQEARDITGMSPDMTRPQVYMMHNVQTKQPDPFLYGGGDHRLQRSYPNSAPHAKQPPPVLPPGYAQPPPPGYYYDDWSISTRYDVRQPQFPTQHNPYHPQRHLATQPRPYYHDQSPETSYRQATSSPWP